MTCTLRKKEILIDILVRLPAKSLVRFLCICKSWSDLIGSSSFVSKHLHRNVTKHAHVYLLCLHNPNCECLVPCVGHKLQLSLFSKETFECSTLCHPLGSPEHYLMYGSSNGLVCTSDAILNFKSSIHIWNPLVRKSRVLPVSTNSEFDYIALYFGFHPIANDYKAVRMMCMDNDAFAVEVYSLITDSWKMIEVVPPWLECNWKHNKGTILNGVVYHLIEKGPSTFSIMSFDSGTEIFEEIVAPGAICRSQGLCIDVYKEQICLLFDFYECMEEGMEQTDVWVLNELKQWEQLLPFVYHSDSYHAMGISIDNELLLMKIDVITGGVADLYFLNYECRQVRETGIKLAVMKYGNHELLIANTYIESLVLLN